MYRRGLLERGWKLTVPELLKDWKREFLLLAGLLQKELGRLPCALVRYTFSYSAWS